MSRPRGAGEDESDVYLELGIALGAAASVVLSVWDLLRNQARDLSGGICLMQTGMVVGCGLQTLLPGGFLLGTVTGFVLGVATLARSTRARRGRLELRLQAAPDEASSLLVLHDRWDSLTGTGGRLRWITPFLSVLAFALVGAGLLAFGLRLDAWEFVFLGSTTLFLPVSVTARLVVEAREIAVVGSRLPTASPEARALGSPGRTTDRGRVR